MGWERWELLLGMPLRRGFDFSGDETVDLVYDRVGLLNDGLVDTGLPGVSTMQCYITSRYNLADYLVVGLHQRKRTT